MIVVFFTDLILRNPHKENDVKIYKKSRPDYKSPNIVVNAMGILRFCYQSDAFVKISILALPGAKVRLSSAFY